MASRAVTNTLLLLVVVCLALIAVKMYNINPVAEAAGVGAKPTVYSAIVGCYTEFSGQCTWRFIRVTDEGVLATIK